MSLQKEVSEGKKGFLFSLTELLYTAIYVLKTSSNNYMRNIFNHNWFRHWRLERPCTQWIPSCASEQMWAIKSSSKVGLPHPTCNNLASELCQLLKFHSYTAQNYFTSPNCHFLLGKRNVSWEQKFWKRKNSWACHSFLLWRTPILSVDELFHYHQVKCN